MLKGTFQILEYRLSQLTNGQPVAIVTLFKEASVQKSLLQAGENTYSGWGGKIELSIYDKAQQETLRQAFSQNKEVIIQ